MKCKLVHPAWTHLPAIAVLVWMIVRLITSLPLPKEAAVHFSVSGIPDSFGKPWLAVALTCYRSDRRWGGPNRGPRKALSWSGEAVRGPLIVEPK